MSMKMSDLKMPEWKVYIRVGEKRPGGQQIERVLIVSAKDEREAKKLALGQVKTMDIGFNTFRVIAAHPVS